MKSINAVILYIGLSVILCTHGVVTFCGNDDQIEDLTTALIIHESSCTLFTTLSAIPITGAALTFAQASTSVQFGMHLNQAFNEMEDSLNKDHKDYQKCSEVLKKTLTAAAVIKSTNIGFSIASMIPGVGVALLPPRLAASISAMIFIRDGLRFWQKNKCQYATQRECKL